MNRPGAYLQAMGGHVVDLWRMARFEVGVPYSYSKFRNIKAVRRRSGARMMIETGTFLGVTAARCAGVFEKVWTIELDPALAGRAREYLRRWGNVEVVEGDALKKLPEVLGRGDVQDVLVFLDGHFSGGATAKGELVEPAVEEVNVLGAFREKIRGVVIDDFRCFGVEAGWPSKSALLKSIEAHFPEGFVTTVHLDQVLVSRVR